MDFLCRLTKKHPNENSQAGLKQKKDRGTTSLNVKASAELMHMSAAEDYNDLSLNRYTHTKIYFEHSKTSPLRCGIR